MMQSISDRITKHISPALELGSGKTKRVHKLVSLVHTLQLLAPTYQYIPTLARTLAATTSDMGVEAGVPRAQPFKLRDMVPYIDAAPPAQAPDADDFEDLPPLWDPEVDLGGCTEIPGLLHIIHNAGRGLEKKLLEYGDSYLRLQKVSNMLRKAESKQRLQSTCFNTSVGEELFAASIKRFSAQCYNDRWTTVADCVMKMSAEVKSALDWGWSLRSYRFGVSSELPTDESHEDFASRLDLIDDALVNRFWWSYWNMLQRLAHILVETTAWAESCPCHGNLRQDIRSHSDDKGESGTGSLANITREALQCPLRGRRCAELAAGDFQSFIDMLFKQQACLLLLEMDPSLNDGERMRNMKDFERGRQHLITQFTVKLSHWEEGHWHMHGMAHHDQVKAYACYLKSRDSTDDHPLLAHLRDERLEEDRKFYEYFKGLHDELSEAKCAKIRILIAKMRLTPSAERPGERLHAVVHKEAMRAPHNSIAAISLTNRFPAISQFVTAHPENLVKFAKTVQQLRHGRECARRLGFQNHPLSAAASKDARHPVHYEVVYRADTWSKYEMKEPKITFKSADVRPTPGINNTHAHTRHTHTHHTHVRAFR